ncbi:MAG: trehalose-6-phosphate synthase [Alphaproteobacteria bacterium]|nr:trehalose-6-phosphate synthase [Alphaproteobacteria bacterium]
MARIFIISNRVAIPMAGANPGGLEVVLKATLKNHPCVWLGWSGEVNADPQVATLKKGKNTYIVTDLPPEDFDEYYNGFANRVLWPIFHYRLDLAEFSRRDLSGYLRVNDRFADELVKVLAPDDIVWVHDYHLIPLAKALRARGLQNRIGFFLHIPLPPPEILTAMPNHETLIPSLGSYDLVGFQTDGDAANFARYLAKELGTPSHISHRVSGGARSMRIGTFPVGIETRDFTRLAGRAVKTKFVQQVLKSIPGALMIGVDRLDYSKGIPNRLEAYERFLIAHPQWHDKITYLQITPKSRSQIKEYSDIEQAVNSISGRINGAFSDAAWAPVRYVNRPYSRTALAGLYRAARVGLVTPMRDGMNLVAKEYVASQDPEDPGVLILSRFAGAADEMRAALLVNPYDPDAVGAAIARAMAMPLGERKSRHAELYATLLDNDIGTWGDRFLKVLGPGPSGEVQALSDFIAEAS